MPWVYLIIAGVFEWGWPIGLKLGSLTQGYNFYWLGFSGLCMFISGYLLLLAQRTIPIGTAYAVWTGIGAVGTFVLGILIFNDIATFERFLFIGLIIVGIIGLKLVHK